MTISDIHWGTRSSQAKRLARVLEHTQADKIALIGDIIDGTHLEEKEHWNFGAWHRQGIAHILRKQAQGTEITYITGNHDAALRGKLIKTPDGNRTPHRRMTGKALFGVKVKNSTTHTDPQNRKFLLLHGDQYDGKISALYHIGDVAYNALYEMDVQLQKLTPLFRKFSGTQKLASSLEHFSLAATGKRAVKTFINECLQARKKLMDGIENSANNGAIYGHTHMEGMEHTASGKLVINDGCCTEHVQCAVHDKHGNFAVITWHKHHMEIQMEDGNHYSVPFKLIGLDEAFSREPTAFEDEHTHNTDRVLRLVYRLWPAKDRQKQRQKIASTIQDTQNDLAALDHPQIEHWPDHAGLVHATRDKLAAMKAAYHALPIPRHTRPAEHIAAPAMG